MAGLTIRWWNKDSGLERRQYSPTCTRYGRWLSLLQGPCGSHWSLGPAWLPKMYGSAQRTFFAHVADEKRDLRLSGWNDSSQLSNLYFSEHCLCPGLAWLQGVPFLRAFQKHIHFPRKTWCLKTQPILLAGAEQQPKRRIEKVTGREWSSWTDSSTQGIRLLPSIYSDVIYRTAWFTSPSHKQS